MTSMVSTATATAARASDRVLRHNRRPGRSVTPSPAFRLALMSDAERVADVMQASVLAVGYER